MVKGRVSVVIPARNERYAARTAMDLLDNASGDTEVILCLDGYWPPASEDQALRDVEAAQWQELVARQDKRLILFHRGRSHGMRPGINAGVQIAKGEYILKADAHTKWGEGFDEILKADCDDDWVVVPRRMSLDPVNWCKLENGKSPVDYHYLSNPFERPGDPTCGMHGTWHRERARERKHILIDDEQSSQGSAYFMKRIHWDRTIGPLDSVHFSTFVGEFQEVGNRSWLSGGAVKVNKKTHYLHWHKGAVGGRGYSISKREQAAGSDFSTRYWMLDEWKARKHDLIWLIRKFWPVPSWGDDPEAVFAHARATLQPTGAD